MAQKKRSECGTQELAAGRLLVVHRIHHHSHYQHFLSTFLAIGRTPQTAQGILHSLWSLLEVGEEGFPQPLVLHTVNKVTGLSGSSLCDAQSCCVRAGQSNTAAALWSRLHSHLSYQVSTILIPVLFSGSLTFDEGKFKINCVRRASHTSLQYSK